MFTALRPGPRYSSWQDRDSATAARGISGSLTTMLSSILDIRPRSVLLDELEKPSFEGTLLGSRISVLSETAPGILSQILAEFAKYPNTADDEHLLRDLHILEHISHVTKDADSGSVAIATMRVLEKITVLGRRQNQLTYAACLHVIIRTIRHRLKDCTPRMQVSFRGSKPC
jgi:hypothetical protein